MKASIRSEYCPLTRIVLWLTLGLLNAWVLSESHWKLEREWFWDHFEGAERRCKEEMMRSWKVGSWRSGRRWRDDKLIRWWGEKMKNWEDEMTNRWEVDKKLRSCTWRVSWWRTRRRRKRTTWSMRSTLTIYIMNIFHIMSYISYHISYIILKIDWQDRPQRSRRAHRSGRAAGWRWGQIGFLLILSSQSSPSSSWSTWQALPSWSS